MEKSFDMINSMPKTKRSSQFMLNEFGKVFHQRACSIFVILTFLGSILSMAVISFIIFQIRNKPVLSITSSTATSSTALSTSTTFSTTTITTTTTTTTVTITTSTQSTMSLTCEPPCPCGSVSSYTQWQIYNSDQITITIDTSSCHFSQIPIYFTSMAGIGWHYGLGGYGAIYSATNSSFTIYANSLFGWNAAQLFNSSQTYLWDVNWFGIYY